MWYLAIIMVLSIGCSIALYHVSKGELERNARRSLDPISRLLRNDDIRSLNRLRLNQLDEDISHLKGRLLTFNLLVLIFGGAASYGLARRTLRPIEETLEAQKRFSGDASHELRTPLTAMQTELEVALRNRNLSKAQAKELLQSSLEEVVKLRGLSDGLLALASGEKINLKQVVPVKDIFTEAVDRTAKIAKVKKISVKRDSGNLKVKGNREQLAQLVTILLDNAIKYSSPGQEVELKAEARDKKVVMSVLDSGNGIRHKDLPRIFERFYRADQSRNKDVVEGYGLGLAIAKKILDLHKGHIEVESIPSKGSTFRIYIG